MSPPRSGPDALPPPGTPDFTPTFTPVADHAVLVAFGTEVSDSTNDMVLALDREMNRALCTDAVPGVVEVVPAFVNALIVFDPLRTDHAAVEAAIRRLLPLEAVHTTDARLHTVPVCYEADFAPDLADVAAASGLVVDEVIAIHLASEYRVAMYGFAPGYAYLSGVPETIQLPRKPAPVRGVAAGSVIIAGPQCLVTTLEMPTGWSVIGRSPARILQDSTRSAETRPDEPLRDGSLHDQPRSDAADRPFLFDVGDRITFERIDVETFQLLDHRR